MVWFILAYPLKTSPPVFMLEIGNLALFSIVGT
jgi:hypothetical protein